MKLLYAHDHKFYKYEEDYYSNGSFSREALSRYTSIFEEVKFASRQIRVEKRPKNMSIASIEKISFVEIPNFKSIRNYYKRIKACEIIKNEVKECDTVIARLPSSIGAIAVKYAKKYKKPYLIEVVACPWDELWNYNLKGKLLAPINYFRTKQLIKRAKYVVYVTNNFLQTRYPTNGKYTNCSNVALTEFDDNVLERRLNKIKSIEDTDKIVIGTTAAVNVRYKGQQYIIQALGELKKQGVTDLEYQIVGGGNQTFLKSIAKKHDVIDQVKFLGAMPHDEVFKWLDTIDIYTQPSRQEGLPRALIEAMSRAIPAFGARTAGIPELLDNEFIFSNTRKNIDEICDILKCFDKVIMTAQSKRNYDESKKYDKEVIEERRKKFFDEFKNSEG
jgi:glycosyltransferase involved in cell wall biosynthesis